VVDDFLFGWSQGRHDVWIGGFSGILMHFDGLRWTQINDVTHGAPYAGFGTGPGTDVLNLEDLLVGERLHGRQYGPGHPHPSGPDVRTAG